MSAGDSFLQGMDVSKWQATTPSLSGVKFLVARCTFGEKTDPLYGTHIGNADKAGVPVLGAYHFAYDYISISSQVDHFLAAAGGVDFLALDVEGPDALTKAQATQFISLLRSRDPLKRKIALYMSESPWLGDCGQDIDWVANYSREPRIHYDIWQYGPYNGADGNFYAGTLSDLLTLIGKEPTVIPAPITDETAKLVTKAAGTPWYDLDGKTVLVASPGALAARVSPFAVGSLRAIYGTVRAVRRIVLIKPATIAPVPDPLADDLAAAKAQADAAVAAKIAAEADAKAARDALAGAADAERTRIATKLGDQERNRIQSA